MAKSKKPTPSNTKGSIPQINAKTGSVKKESPAKLTIDQIPSKDELTAPSDDEIDLEIWNQESEALNPKSKVGIKPNSLAASSCPQGKQKAVNRKTCALAPPFDTNNYIIHLHVKLSTQNLKVTWKNGKIENWLCSPNPKLTPRMTDVVGLKCGVNHTNLKRDGMAWFTTIKRYYMAIGFHNSQPVGKGIYSHGCIRVSCEKAKIINQNSWSGKTKVTIVR